MRAAAVLVLALAALAAAPSDALAPYRALAGAPPGARLLALARAAMVAHWSGAPADQSGAPDWPAAPAAVYVSLVRGTATRACVGSGTPLGSLPATVAALADQALAADPRHPPVRREELDSLRIVLSFAGPGEPVDDPMRVDPGREGLLVSSPRGAIAFLPGEARTVSWALREARRAGVLRGPLDSATYQRFAVVTLQEVRRPAEEGSDAAP